MSTGTKIQWTDATWNPVAGCTRASRGCDNCYAVTKSYRAETCGIEKYSGLTVLNNRGHRHFNGKVRTIDKALKQPLKWRKPKLVFVNSMSDLFHKDVPEAFIHEVFDVMARSTKHRFQVLTKRSERLMKLAPTLPWPSNVWMGVSVEDQQALIRADHLRRTGAAVKFLSLEPLLEAMPKLELSNIDWVIVGGESGVADQEISDAHCPW